jgi:hypothetical protein
MLGETLYTSRYYPVAHVRRYLQWLWAWSHIMCQCEQRNWTGVEGVETKESARADGSEDGGAGAEDGPEDGETP